MSKHFRAEREGEARPQLDTLKAIIVIWDKANQGGDMGASISAGNRMTLSLAGSPISPGSWCYKGCPAVTL